MGSAKEAALRRGIHQGIRAPLIKHSLDLIRSVGLSRWSGSCRAEPFLRLDKAVPSTRKVRLVWKAFDFGSCSGPGLEQFPAHSRHPRSLSGATRAAAIASRNVFDARAEYDYVNLMLQSIKQEHQLFVADRPVEHKEQTQPRTIRVAPGRAGRTSNSAHVAERGRKERT
jgi:hypothetical protein